jgi:hypothetical protein
MIPDMFQTSASRRQTEQFADLLDGRLAASGHELESLVTLATSMPTPEIAPSTDFSAALRARLVQETSQRSPAARVPAQRTTEAQEPRSQRIRQAVAALTAVVIVGGAGAAAASSRALPGDSLYSLKRGLESAQLSLAGTEMARGRELLEQADARLGEAERLAGSSHAADAITRDRIGQALSDMNTALSEGSTLLTDVYRQTGDPAALELLDRFVIDQQRRLDALLDRLGSIDPALRDDAVATADLLASLHAQVAGVTGSALGVDSAADAARSPRASGDGWEVSRAADNLVLTQGLVGGTGSSPSSATDAPQGSDGSGDGLVEDLAEAGAGAAAVIGTPDAGTTATGDSTDSTVTAPTVAPPPVPITPTVPLPVPEVQLDLSCFPVAPLTTC